MNLISLINRVQSRVPGYSTGEYIREINDAYADVWDYILQLDDSYFTDIKTVTVLSQTAAEFDFAWNANGALSAGISNRYFQIDRIRVLQPGQSNWFAAQPRPWNDSQFLMLQQLTPQQPAQNAPYLYVLMSKSSVLFAQPMPVGTQIEVVYTFFFLPLNVTSTGTITTNGTTTIVNGSGTGFTGVVGPDFAGGLPGIDQDTDIGLEFVIGSVAPTNDGVAYRVKNVQNDALANTWTVITPALTGASFNLAMVPDIPDGHHRVIATRATRNIMSTPAKDPRFAQWAAMDQEQMTMLRDTVMTRQRQQPARRQRFTQSVLRYQIAPPGR